MIDDEQQSTTTHPPPSNEMSPVTFGILAGIGVSTFSLLGAALALMKVPHDSPYFPILLGLAQFGLMLLPTLYLAQSQSLPLRDLFRLRSFSPMTLVAVFIGVLSLSLALQAYQVFQDNYLVPAALKAAYVKMTRQTQESIVTLARAQDIGSLLLVLFAAALAPAISEEFLFRGLVQRSFERRRRPMTAIILAGTMFGSVHLQPVNIVVLTVLGIFFGYVAWSTRSIYPCIFGHFVFNAQTIIALYVNKGFDAASAPSTLDLSEILPLAIPSLAVFIGVIFWLRAMQRSANTDAAPTDSAAVADIDAVAEHHDPTDPS